MPKLDIAPTGRITYRKLGEIIKQMDDEQLDMDVTIEDDYEDECWAGELTICDKDHPTLDQWHPTIRKITDET